jgi:hypothetical protein
MREEREIKKASEAGLRLKTVLVSRAEGLASGLSRHRIGQYWQKVSRAFPARCADCYLFGELKSLADYFWNKADERDFTVYA